MSNQTETRLAKRTTNNSLQLFTDEQLDLLVEAAATTGVKSKGEALMIFQKAAELGIGAANAIPHIHLVNGKAGIDIHIVKAILSRPSSGVTWELIDDFKPLYNYSDGTNTYTNDTLPKNYVILSKLSGNPQVEIEKANGNHPVAIVPKVVIVKGKPVRTIEPIDYITTYKFKRVKRNLKGDWIEVTTTSSFKWSEAVAAKLPIDKNGEYNSNSNWQKYRKLMLGIRAFTYGARDIASDLLLGTYETTELYEFNDVTYDIDVEGKTTIIDAD